MTTIAAYQTLKDKQRICPICAHLHWDNEFIPLYSTDIGDYNCGVCKNFIRVMPVWNDAPFHTSYWKGVKRRSFELACVFAAVGLIFLIVYLAQGD